MVHEGLYQQGSVRVLGSLICVALAGYLGVEASSAATGIDPGSAPVASGSAQSSATPDGSPVVQLSPEERAWVEGHPVLRVAATPDWPPFEFVDDEGVYKGINVDFLRLITRRVGFTFEPVHGKWPDLERMLEEAKLDLCPGLHENEERRRYLAFTLPTGDLPHFLYVRKERDDIASLQDLQGKRISVERGYSVHAHLAKHHPAIKLVVVESALEALLEVSSGEADAYVGNVAVASYLIRENVIPNLKAVGQSDMMPLRFAMGVRKDAPILVDILNKGIRSISADEKRAIIERYAQVSLLTELTAEELAWIREHPVIRLGVDTEFAPFEYVTEDGTYHGVAADYVRILNERLGLRMQVVNTRAWDEVVQAAKSREVDVLPCVGVTDERRRFLLFSKPYVSSSRIIVTRKDSPFTGDLADLEGARVAVKADTYHHHFLLEQTALEPALYDTAEATLAAVAHGKADAAVMDVAVAEHWIRQAALTNIKITAPIGTRTSELCFGVRSDWPELVDIINKGLESLTEAEAQAIRKRWMAIEVEPGLHLGRVMRVVGAIVGVATLVVVLLGLHNRRLRREITRRIEAQRALKETRQDYEDLVERVNSIILRMSPDGTITFFNSFAERFFGYAADDIVGKNIFGTIVPEVETSGRDLREMIRDIARHPDRYEANENENVTSAGQRVWVAWTNRPVYNERGEVAEVLCVGNDVTARKRAEKALREAKQAAEEANRAKSAFLANMSHEIRTPMNAILGYAQLLEQDPDLAPEHRDAIAAIGRSGEHLLALINDVLEMSRIEAGRLRLSPSTFDFRDLLFGIETMFRVRTDAKGLMLRMEIDEDVPAFVKADENRVRQVIINLISNAVKFTDKGSVCVRVVRGAESERQENTSRTDREERVSAVDVALSDKAFTIALEVKDTGCGIAAEECERIFESFEQASEGAMKRGGTGLGLSISRSLARMMGGEVNVTSALGKGSCFCFTFLAEPGVESDVAVRMPRRRVLHLKPGHPEVRVLVVDDRDTNRDLLSKMLRKVGFVTREADNGRSALELYQDWQPRLVLIDLIMPVMNGREAIRRMRAAPNGSDVAIIAVTASVLEEDWADVTAAGADALLRKPFRRDHLLEDIRSCTGVEYEYGEAPDEEGETNTDGVALLTPSTLNTLPRELAEELRQVVIMGSIDGALRAAKRVRRHMPALADTIRRAAHNYSLSILEPLFGNSEEEP